MPKRTSAALAIVLALSVSACGMRGSLSMPPGPAPEPLLGNRKAAPPSETGALRPATANPEALAK